MFVVIVLGLGNRIFLQINNKIGSRRIFFHISPGKTVEGILIMYFLNLGLSLTLNFFCGRWLVPNLDFMDFVLLSLIVIFIQLSSTGMLGSTIGSFIKRVAMVKDSGASTLGIRGVFDQVDYLILGLPAIYYYIIYFKHNYQ